jgi:hypothetical protein
MRNLWLGAIVVEALLARLALVDIPNNYFFLPPGANVLDPDVLIPSLHAHQRLVAITWPPIAIAATIIVPTSVLGITARWMMLHSPPLRRPPQMFLKPVGILVAWVPCLSALMFITAIVGVSGGPITRCLQALPILLFVGFFWLRAVTHPRHAIID